MSNSTRFGSLALDFWVTLYVVLKLAGPCAAWSWWWLLVPAVPPLVEFVKHLQRVS